MTATSEMQKALGDVDSNYLKLRQLLKDLSQSHNSAAIKRQGGGVYKSIMVVSFVNLHHPADSAKRTTGLFSLACVMPAKGGQVFFESWTLRPLNQIKDEAHSEGETVKAFCRGHKTCWPEGVAHFLQALCAGNKTAILLGSHYGTLPLVFQEALLTADGTICANAIDLDVLANMNCLGTEEQQLSEEHDTVLQFLDQYGHSALPITKTSKDVADENRPLRVHTNAEARTLCLLLDSARREEREPDWYGPGDYSALASALHLQQPQAFNIQFSRQEQQKLRDESPDSNATARVKDTTPTQPTPPPTTPSPMPGRVKYALALYKREGEEFAKQLCNASKPHFGLGFSNLAWTAYKTHKRYNRISEEYETVGKEVHTITADGYLKFAGALVKTGDWSGVTDSMMRSLSHAISGRSAVDEWYSSLPPGDPQRPEIEPHKRFIDVLQQTQSLLKPLYELGKGMRRDFPELIQAFEHLSN